MRVLLLLLLILGAVGCAGPASSTSGTTGMQEFITVEGRVSVRGNEPFSGVVLQTDQSNYYVLALDAAQRAAMVPTLPARYRISGLLYGAEWNGQLYAHLRPSLIELQ